MKKKIIYVLGIAIIISLIIIIILLFGGKKEYVTISFNTDGGNEIADVEVEKGKTTTLPTPKKDSYTFSGWYLNSEKISNDYVFNENVLLKASWEATKTFKVSFDTDGGNEIDAMEIKCGEGITLPEEPTKKGYTFISWENEDKKTIHNNDKLECIDTTLTANWDKEDDLEDNSNLTIKFDSKGGSEVKSIKIKCKEAVVPTLPTPTKEGYIFTSWTTKAGKVMTAGISLDCDNTTFYANWKEDPNAPKYYTVTFDSKGGSKVDTIKVECEKTLSLPKNPTRDGYDFVAWTDKNGKAILDGAKLTCENITLYADWKEKETVTPEPKKEYTCPEGYTLKDDKCLIEGTVKETCPENTKTDGSLCIKTSDNNAGTRQCKEDTVSIDGKGHTWTGKGDYYLAGFGHCAYYKWTDYTTQSQCEGVSDINHKTKWVSALNACYAEVKDNNYETICASDYQYYSSEQLSSKFGINDNGKCLKKVSKIKYCDEGFTLTDNKCIKTVNATVK